MPRNAVQGWSPSASGTTQAKLAGRLLAIPATIVMPHDAPAGKLAATKGYGGNVVLYDRYTEDREQIGCKLSQEYGLTLIPPYDHFRM